jgi:hypothetical protein
MYVVYCHLLAESMSCARSLQLSTRTPDVWILESALFSYTMLYCWYCHALTVRHVMVACLALPRADIMSYATSPQLCGQLRKLRAVVCTADMVKLKRHQCRNAWLLQVVCCLMALQSSCDTQHVMRWSHVQLCHVLATCDVIMSGLSTMCCRTETLRL